jgi:UrcA family protein
MFKFKAFLLMVAGATGAMGAGAAGAAQPASDVPQVAVRFDPASLRTDEGAKVVYRRLEQAAERVCGNFSNGRLVPQAILDCRQKAVSDAVAQIHDTRLAAVDASRVRRG